MTNESISVIARVFASIPHRSASETWSAIVDLFAPAAESPARAELLGIAGIAASIIADEAPSDDAIVLFGSGPRIRVYTVYGDDAIEGNDISESPLNFIPTMDDWRLSLPCRSDDLAWIQRALQSSPHTSARALGEAVDEAQASERSALRTATRHVSLNAFNRL
jgi:hypothetical protein